MDRRAFLRLVAALGASHALDLVAAPSATAAAKKGTFTRVRPSTLAVVGSGPYGPLRSPDKNGIQLPKGFTSRLLAETGQPVRTVSGNPSGIWHVAPDGGACFANPKGGWIYVSNSEVSEGGGGVRALSFDRTGGVIGSHTILSGTSRNCAGGPTPWGTWLSCEESGAAGKVWECNPLAASQGVVRPALGSFNHEAAVVDPATGELYLTEDAPDGRLYKFIPTVRGDLREGRLYAASVTDSKVSWIATSADEPDRSNATTPFNGGEGLWVGDGSVFFTTKGDVRVWELSLSTSLLRVLYDVNRSNGGALNAVDNITMHQPSGDLYVAEDGGNMELCTLSISNRRNEVAPFLRIVGQDESEITGPAFSPDQRRLYFSSQRGADGRTGRTYEITGPFRR